MTSKVEHSFVGYRHLNTNPNCVQSSARSLWRRNWNDTWL